jgi:hypothetical protein
MNFWSKFRNRNDSTQIQFGKIKSSSEVEKQIREYITVGETSLNSAKSFLESQRLNYGFHDLRFDGIRRWHYTSEIQELSNVEFDSYILFVADAPNPMWPPTDWMISLSYWIVLYFDNDVLIDIKAKQVASGP